MLLCVSEKEEKSTLTVSLVLFTPDQQKLDRLIPDEGQISQSVEQQASIHPNKSSDSRSNSGLKFDPSLKNDSSVIRVCAHLLGVDSNVDGLVFEYLQRRGG